MRESFQRDGCKLLPSALASGVLSTSRPLVLARDFGPPSASVVPHLPPHPSKQGFSTLTLEVIKIRTAEIF